MTTDTEPDSDSHLKVNRLIIYNDAQSLAVFFFAADFSPYGISLKLVCVLGISLELL